MLPFLNILFTLRDTDIKNDQFSYEFINTNNNLKTKLDKTYSIRRCY